MSEALVIAIQPALRAPTTLARIHQHLRQWRDAVYLGIGSFSLTWPVAAFLRGL